MVIDTIAGGIEFCKKNDIHFFPVIPAGTKIGTDKDGKDIIATGKEPALKWKEYANKWMTDSEIKHYFVDNHYNIGYICSHGFFCLDFDKEDVFSKFFTHPEGLTIVSTGRGKHVYLRSNSEIKTLKSFGKDGAEDLTLKGNPSYVVGIGSVHKSGKIYTLIQGDKVNTLKGDPRDFTKKRALAIGLSLGNSEGTEIVDAKELLKGVAEGGRDTAAFDVATYLRRAETVREEATSIMYKWNARNRPPLEGSVIDEKIRNVFEMPEPYSTRFITNPKNERIKEDLTLELQIPKGKIEVPDLFFKDTQGRIKIGWEILREFVQEKYIFKTILDTDELMVYKKGVYVDARKTIRDFVHTIEGIGDQGSIRIIRELTEHIKARTGVEREEFNKDPSYLPVNNGLFNFKTRELESFDPEKLYTYRLPVKYNPDATFKATERFMKEVVNEGDLDILKEWFGYSIYPAFPSHHFAWFYGGGRNGKGVTTKLLSALVGKENKANVPLAHLDEFHRFTSVNLKDAFINVIPEADTKNGLQTEMLKRMTGDDMISGERKGVQEPIKFHNFAKFLVHSNAFPTISDTSFAFWDRVLPIPFPKEFKGHKANKHLAEEIIAEDGVSGILNYALDGFYRLRENEWEFTSSKTQEDLKADMRRMAQPTETFLDQWTLLKNTKATPYDKLYNAMLTYCNIYGVIPPSERDFERNTLRNSHIKKGVYQHDGHRIRTYLGIVIKEEMLNLISKKALEEANDSKKEEEEVDVDLSKDSRGGN
jgi:P4 family phage/plasmid primase-like protien